MHMKNSASESKTFKSSSTEESPGRANFSNSRLHPFLNPKILGSFLLRKID